MSLLFLISQPRAGSTLLQKILGNHSEIYSPSEPWLMLPPMYSLKPKNCSAEYDTNLCYKGIKSFLDNLPAGEQEYFKGLSHMYSYLYNQALLGTGKSHFLDKTPRYYHIIPEIAKTFPNAKFIILFRNPLAVLCSIIRAWIRQRWFRLIYYRHDLIKAPFKLREAISLLESRCLVVKYEDLLLNPEIEIQNILQWLDLSFEKNILNYNSGTGKSNNMGDHTGLINKGKLESQNLDKWVDDLNNPQIWKLARDYLKYLDRDIVEAMGYNFDKLNNWLDNYCPSKINLWRRFSLFYLLNDPNDLHRILYGCKYESMLQANKLKNGIKISLNLN